MCHEPQPARRKKDADATQTNQLNVTGIFCGKLSYCPASDPTRPRTSTESLRNQGFSSLFTVKLRSGMAALRDQNSARTRQGLISPERKRPKWPPETKDPSG